MDYCNSGVIDIAFNSVYIIIIAFNGVYLQVWQLIVDWLTCLDGLICCSGGCWLTKHILSKVCTFINNLNG